MSIRWIRNVLIDNEKSTIEVQVGDKRIGDKCYVRVNNELEHWFETRSMERNDIVEQGKERLREWLQGKELKYPDGREYDWQ